MPGITHTPVAGQFVCGDGTICGQWYAQQLRPLLTLGAEPFGISITAGGNVSISFSKPRLSLLARRLALQLSSSPAPGKALLLLNARPLYVQPFLRVELGRPLLELDARVFVLGLSSSPVLARPLLHLLARELTRVGRAGLVPTIPELVTLTPSVCEPQVLVAAVCEQELLVPSVVEVR